MHQRNSSKNPSCYSSLVLAMMISLLTMMMTAQILFLVVPASVEDTAPDDISYAEGVELNERGNTLIPFSTLRHWESTEYLVVLGIPSEDIPERRGRRELQRKTCWTYDGVARRDNNYTGSMIVLYALARSALYNFEYSSDLKEEASKWHDIVTLPLNEGTKSTGKKIGGDGHWGIEAEIGMSRKAYFWFYTANKLFPLASYIAKGDDDIFLRVPVYLTTLRTLPRRGLYWGYGSTEMHKTSLFQSVPVFYTFGMCTTVATDVVEQILEYKPLRELVHTPYSKSIEDRFMDLRMDHEDLMLGVVLHNTGYEDVVHAWDKACHLHNIHTGTPIGRVTSDSMVIHHLREEEYETLKKIFENVKGPLAPSVVREKKFIRFHCRKDLPTLLAEK